MTHPRSVRSLVLSLVVLVSLAAIAHADLASVRYQRSGSGHLFLSTHANVPVGDREASMSLYLLADRYVAIYTESRRIDATRSEVLVQHELSGSVSGATLANLGTLRELAQQKNGKPVVELALSVPIASSPRGLVVRLAWTYGSWAPKSVTQ